jgi:ribonuclease PH
MNVVMTGREQLVEVQATAEGRAFSVEEMNKLVEVARPAIQKLVALQQSILKLALPTK